MKSKTFGQLLKAGIASITYCERKRAPVVEEDLGHQIGVAPSSIQRYKAGHIPPEPRTVELLAEACVHRGLMGREWLQQFLHAARHPIPEKVLNRLVPVSTVGKRSPRVYHNLPAAPFSQFITRTPVFSEIIDGLQSRSAVVLIAGLGGNGKTSLAYELAVRCLSPDENVPTFDSVVWVSDENRPGSTHLSLVLDEIVRTLDYPGFAQFAHEEKLFEVGNLLRKQPVLVIIDMFETVTDQALIEWLLRLPAPSKAIVTSREYRREFRRSCWPIELRGMTDSEAHALIDERVRFLGVQGRITSDHEFEPLVTATGGNPKAIVVALGLVKYERRTLHDIVDDLYLARGELFDNLFGRAWALLDEAARRVLLVATFFPGSITPDALRSTADIDHFAFDRAAERLTDMALLDVQQPDLRSLPRYTVHPLVRAYARARLENLSESPFEEAARRRWVQWYVARTAQVGYCRNDLARLALLDNEVEAVFAATEWAFAHKLYCEVIGLTAEASFYYHVRGLWDLQLKSERMRAQAARAVGEIGQEIKAIAYEVQVLSKQDRMDEAQQRLKRLRHLVRNRILPDDVQFEFQRARAFYLTAHRDFDATQRVWQETLPTAKRLSDWTYIVARGWLGTCLYEKRLLPEAQSLLREVLHDTKQFQFARGISAELTKLARVDLALGQLDAARAALEQSIVTARESQDREHIAEIQRAYAELHRRCGDLPAAIIALTEATDLFERLGMRRALAESREELSRLETEIAARDV